jgi:hypothetical protein
MTVGLGILCWLHRPLDDLLAAERLDNASFRFWHRVYLWTSTVQWFLAVAYVPLLLRGWQREDAAAVLRGGRQGSGELVG